jgi:hypothetical protein
MQRRISFGGRCLGLEFSQRPWHIKFAIISRRRIAAATAPVLELDARSLTKDRAVLQREASLGTMPRFVEISLDPASALWGLCTCLPEL